MAKILNFGSLNIDRIYNVDEIVKPGQTINSINYEELIGGKGLNQSVALAKAKSEVWHAGLVGNKDGSPLVERLEEAGVEVSLIQFLDGPSGHALIQIDKEGMNCIIVDGGTNRKVDEDYIDLVLKRFSEGDYLLIQNEISNIPLIIDKAYEKGMVIAFNPSPMDSYVKEVDLNKVSYFLINEHEAEALAGNKDSEKIIKILKEKYPKARLVLTLGDKGARYLYKDKDFSVEPIKIRPVDTTGAGDTFTGFFLASIIQGKSAEEAMSLANKAAAMACLKKGASNSIPDLGEVEAWKI